MSDAVRSAMAHVVRAMKQHDPIEACISQYRSRRPYKAVLQADGKRVLELTEEPPLEISVLSEPASRDCYVPPVALSPVLLEAVQDINYVSNP